MVAQGRSRRAAIGLFHQRPENLHAVERPLGASGAIATGRGHSASVAAMMTAASSSVGVGDIATPVGGANGFSGWVTKCRLGVFVVC